jgi:hypothetical protein
MKPTPVQGLNWPLKLGLTKEFRHVFFSHHKPHTVDKLKNQEILYQSEQGGSLKTRSILNVITEAVHIPFYVLHIQPDDGYVASRNMQLPFILIFICKNKATF